MRLPDLLPLDAGDRDIPERGRVVEQAVVHPHGGTLLSCKRGDTPRHVTAGRIPKTLCYIKRTSHKIPCSAWLIYKMPREVNTKYSLVAARGGEEEKRE